MSSGKEKKMESKTSFSEKSMYTWGKRTGNVFFCGKGAGKMLSGRKVLHPDFREAGRHIESRRKKFEHISVDKWRMREHSKKKESEWTCQ